MFADLLYQLLDGLSVGLVYVLLAAGLSIIFGVMNVINFAHGELYTIGAYFAVAVAGIAGGGGTGFVIALLVAPLLVGLLGVAIERVTVRPLYDRDPLYHILLTFGLVLFLNELVIYVWETDPRNLATPEIISGTFSVAGITYSRYNVFIIVFGSLLAVGVWGLLRYSRFGLIIRAGTQDRQMVRNLGISIDRYYSLVFGLGAALAAIAGIIIGGGGGEVVTGMGMNIIIPAFVIVVIGGLGSFKGAVVAGLGVGILQDGILRHYLPQLEGMMIFLIMIVVLLVRPQGLFGTTFGEGGGHLIVRHDDGILPPRLRRRLGVAMVVLLALIPLGADILYSEFYVTLMVRILIWGLFALSLDFIMGYTGLVSLGHTLFWGIGAYVTAIVLMDVTQSAFIAVALALVVGSAVAWVVGYLSIRVHGVYFAMITLAFAELYYNLVRDLEITGGTDGLFGFSAFYGIGDVGVDLGEIGVFVGPRVLSGRSLFYYIALVALLGAFLLSRRLLDAPFGSVLKAIRENEERVRFIGYDPIKYKRRAFVISGIFGTLAGCLFALNLGLVTPNAAHWLNSGEVLVMVILGGMGTLVGPVIGAFTYFGLEHLMEDVTEHWRLFLGGIFVIFVIFLPSGLVSMPATVQRVYRRLAERWSIPEGDG